jgi:hypothetical protein
MIYEIVLPRHIDDAHFELASDNPHEILETLRALRKQFPQVEPTILRDDLAVDIDDVAADGESYDIQATREQETQLPPTFRDGRTGDSDLGSGTDGERHGVWRPKNPEDDFA